MPPEEVAAVFLEPIQGEGGYVVPPPGWHKKLREVTRKYGILYVADEVQCGMGRTGKMFAMDNFGVVPDIITLAKGIASGMPLGAMMAPAGMMTWEAGSHASTFGGNPVCCAASLATIDLLEGSLLENAARRGEQLMDGLRELQNEFEVIGDVRGLGLMVGAELVKDRETKERAPELVAKVIDHAFQNGLLLLSCGQNTIRFCPALTVSREEIDVCLDILGTVLRKLTA
jgi:4-aminobutyrate aminotransferase